MQGTLSSVLCGDLDEWDGEVGGKIKRKGIYVYILLIHFAVQQKPTQHCKATILQKKKKSHASLGSEMNDCITLRKYLFFKSFSF